MLWLFTLFTTLLYAQVTTRPADIVDIKQVEPSIYVDMMYYANTNFVGQRVNGYKANVCMVTKAAAEGLKLAQARVKAAGRGSHQNLSLLVRDCYRPQKAVKQFVEWSTHTEQTEMKDIFYPELTKAKLIEDNYISPVSGHSRASSIDLTIVRINEKGELEPLPMGTTVDYFGERSHTAYAGIAPEEKRARQLLMDVMRPEFRNYAKEWWHYALNSEPYPKTFFDFDIEAIPPRTPQSGPPRKSSRK
jgi:D-alanyl-D-alanine dipeptidase